MKIQTRKIFVAVSLLFTLLLYLTTGQPAAQTQQAKELKIGLIGLDTSHAPAFTQLLNDESNQGRLPGARVVAAFKGGSPDVEASYTRVDKFTAELKEKWGVEMMGSIEELCGKVDAVIITSVDGRKHLPQVRLVFAAKKRVFIDKPFTASYADAREIVKLSRESGVLFFSSSSLRFAHDVQAIKNDGKLGRLLGAFTYGPAPTEPHHPDLFWYGIHSVEMLYALMGSGCETVTRVRTEGTDVVVGKWKDGRTATVRGIRDGKREYGIVAFGEKGIVATNPPMKSDYRNLLVEVMKFFQTGVPPVQPEETLEMMAFMEAADLSKTRGGGPVKLTEITTQH
jgi:predicted dehydrogenase